MSNTIKITNFKDNEEAIKLLSENIPRYLKYLNDKMASWFTEGFEISEYSKKFFHYNSDEEFYYFVKIISSELKADSMLGVMEGPLSKMYQLDGIADIRIKQSSVVEIIFHAPFFLQEDLFNSFKAVDKFKL